MRVSYSWLKEYVDVDLLPQELADALTMAGVNVEGIEYLNKGIHGVLVGQVSSLKPHPNADRLYVAHINLGDREVQVVTGATNLKVGDKVPVAVPGSTLPGNWELKEVEFRGELSYGMLCSETELLLGKPHLEDEGIMILPSDSPVGAEVVRVLGLDDVVLNLDLTPNYAVHCQSMVGVAIEVAAITGARLKLPQINVKAIESEDVAALINIEIEDPDLCSRYSAKIFKDIRIGPSPAWMQRRLKAAGIRPINNIVDVTNYVMVELGHPLHAFDYHTIRGEKIVVRRAYPGEKIVTLDGQERVLDTEMLLIADAQRSIGIAGVMGGLETEITDRTAKVLLEGASFNPINIRRTAMKLGLRSEASGRFEKGVDPNGTIMAVERAAQLIVEIGAGKVLAGTADVYPRPLQPRRITVRPNRVNSILGTNLQTTEMVDILRGLQMDVAEGEALQVTVPTRRGDIEEEIDIIEEIARIYGYNNIPTTLPEGPLAAAESKESDIIEERVKGVFTAAGFDEVMTYSFANPNDFDKWGLPEDSPLRRVLQLRNPLTEDQSIMRSTLLPGMLQVVANNVNYRTDDVKVYEIGTVYRVDDEQLSKLPHEVRLISAAVSGKVVPRAWNRKQEEADFYYLKGVVETILRHLGINEYEFVALAIPGFHPGRSAAIMVEGFQIGVIGEIHPDVAAAYGLDLRVYMLEMDLAQMQPYINLASVYSPVPRYPSVSRDLAVVVPVNLPAKTVEEVIREHAGHYLEEVTLFDVYSGEPIPQGLRSLAYSLVFRASDRTLTDEEVDADLEAIRRGLHGKLGAQFRG